jgi:glycosyltransferase involved in cell wall biosynthesis
MRVSVVLCTYNGASSLKGTLASFKQLVVPAELTWELVLVNNNSSDSTGKIIEEFVRTSGPNVQGVFEPRQGKGFALNTGIRRTRGEIVAFTDDDVLIDAGWLMGLVSTFARFDCIGVGGKVVPILNQAQPTWLEMEGQQVVGHFDYGEQPKEISVPPIGGNMAFRRAAFEKYGLFRIELGPDGSEIGGNEDDEFGRRLLKAGEKIVYSPAAVVYLPIESYRLTKDYFLRWFYSVGKANMRAKMWPQDTVCYFGVPRYLFGNLLRNWFRWAITFDEKRRFQHKLRVYRAMGGIREALRFGETTKAEIPQL